MSARKTNRPRVSLYIPCYNAQGYLGSVIEGALAQTHRPDEILVIDDGSTDGSDLIAAQYPVRCVQHPRNLGLAAARNTAFKNSTGDLVAALDADVVAAPDWLEKLLGGLAERFAGAGGCLVEAHRMTPADRWRAIMLGQNHGSAPAENMHIYGCNSVWRRSVFERVGGYDERFRSSFEDTDFWNKVRSIGAETCYIPSALCYHQRRDSVLSVIMTCHGWRRPGYELGGLYASTSNLAIGWLTTVGHYTQQALNIAKQGGTDLGGLSLLNIMIHFLKDLAIYGEKHPENGFVVVRHGAAAVTLIGMILTPPLSAERENLFEQLLSFARREPMLSQQSAPAIMQVVHRYRGASAEEALSLSGVGEDMRVQPLNNVLPAISNELQRLAPLAAVVPKLIDDGAPVQSHGTIESRFQIAHADYVGTESPESGNPPGEKNVASSGAALLRP